MEGKMKKLFLLSCICVMVLLQCGCEKEYVNPYSEFEVEKGDNLYDTLTEQQKKYLTEELYLSKTAINEMTYEALNWQLLGTGFELYNQSSGVEKYGLSYEQPEELEMNGTSSNLITIDAAIEIRKKGKEIKLEDFAKYKYTIEKRELSDSYIMQVPVAEYEDTFVDIVYTRDENGIVNMKAPHLRHEEGATDSVFSLLYNKSWLDTFYETEPKYTLEGKKCIGIQYSSITDNSLVIELCNWTNTQYELSESYKVYEVLDGEEKLIYEYEGRDYIVTANSYSIKSVKLGDDCKFEAGKTYLVKYGNDKKGHFYGEISFIK